MNLVIASKNKSKIAEIRKILAPFDISVISLEELFIPIDVEETGSTFAENAVLKAVTIAQMTGEVTIADDSGIEVDALNGAPGIMSARFAGEDATDEDKNELILSLLAEYPRTEWGCAFQCVAALAFPDGRSFTFSGSVRGFVSDPKGDGGFGYDPIFYYPPYGTTFGCVSAEEKNAVSHRGRAFSLLSRFFSLGYASLNKS